MEEALGLFVSTCGNLSKSQKEHLQRPENETYSIEEYKDFEDP
jgi:hypothetical protein